MKIRIIINYNTFQIGRLVVYLNHLMTYTEEVNTWCVAELGITYNERPTEVDTWSTIQKCNYVFHLETNKKHPGLWRKTSTP